MSTKKQTATSKASGNESATRQGPKVDRATARDHVNRGALLHAEGKLDEARAAYAAALRADPKNPSALNNLGYLEAQEGYYDKAIKRLEKAVELNSESAAAAVNLANAKIAAGHREDGIEDLLAISHDDPSNVKAWDSLGKAFLLSGDPASSETAFWTALDLAPREAKLAAALGTVLAHQQKYDEAGAVLERAMSLDPNDADIRARLGVVLFLRHDLGSAEDVLVSALALAPENIVARHHLALTRLAKGDPAAAARELARVLVIEPNAVAARLDLAVIRLSSGDAAAALELLDQVLEVSEDDERAKFYRAAALNEVGKPGLAKRAWTTLAKTGSTKYAERATELLQAT